MIGYDHPVASQVKRSDGFRKKGKNTGFAGLWRVLRTSRCTKDGFGVAVKGGEKKDQLV